MPKVTSVTERLSHENTRLPDDAGGERVFSNEVIAALASEH